MDALKNFTLDDLYNKTALPDQEFLDYLVGLKLLHGQRVCECGGNMSKTNRKNDRQYPNYRCTTRSCRKERGFLTDTFFESSHLTLKEVSCFFMAKLYKRI